MKFVVIVERGLSGPKVFGPFDHQEDAEKYAHDKFGHEVTIWRVTTLLPPEA